MIFPDQFREFVLPVIVEEVKMVDHNIFHMDGKGVANHVDDILAIPEIAAVQWVQGAGPLQPIMQWVPLIKKIQAAGKSVVVDLQVSELEPFMREVGPRGLFLCVEADPEIQPEIIHRLEKWRGIR